jgi:hypothetical protein
MAFVVSSLPDYVNQNSKELLSKAVFGAPSVKHLNLMTGVKYKDAINLVNTEAGLQERTCGWSASGDVTFSQAIMEVGAYKVNMSLCEEDLRKKWMNSEVMTAAGAEVLPFEEKISGEIVDSIKNQVEKLIWQADKSKSDLFNGLLTQIAADSDAIEVESSATTAYGKIKDVYMAIPASILDRAAIFVGVDTFRSYCQDLVTQNLYHYSADLDPEKMEVILPGTNTRVIAVSGLNQTGAIVASDPRNLFYGVDMVDDLEQFKLWYSDDNQEFRLAVKFNAGSAIAFGDLVAYYAPEAEQGATGATGATGN